jgi:hypothetical protein
MKRVATEELEAPIEKKPALTRRELLTMEYLAQVRQGQTQRRIADAVCAAAQRTESGELGNQPIVWRVHDTGVCAPRDEEYDESYWAYWPHARKSGMAVMRALEDRYAKHHHALVLALVRYAWCLVDTKAEDTQLNVSAFSEEDRALILKHTGLASLEALGRITPLKPHGHGVMEMALEQCAVEELELSPFLCYFSLYAS